MPDQSQPEKTQPKKKPAPHEQPAPKGVKRAAETGPQKYLGGTVQSMSAEKAARAQVTTAEASAQLLKAIATVRELGATVEGNLVRVPVQYAGVAAVSYLATHGYRVLWA